MLLCALHPFPPLCLRSVGVCIPERRVFAPVVASVGARFQVTEHAVELHVLRNPAGDVRRHGLHNCAHRCSAPREQRLVGLPQCIHVSVCSTVLAERRHADASASSSARSIAALPGNSGWAPCRKCSHLDVRRNWGDRHGMPMPPTPAPRPSRLSFQGPRKCLVAMPHALTLASRCMRQGLKAAKHGSHAAWASTSAEGACRIAPQCSALLPHRLWQCSCRVRSTSKSKCPIGKHSDRSYVRVSMP